MGTRLSLALAFLIILPLSAVLGKDSLTISLGEDHREGFDPTLSWGHYGSPLFQSTLLKYDAALNVIEDLAQSYDLSRDLKVWRVKIRDDAYFSDGVKLTAHDVVYTYLKAKENAKKTDLTNLKTAKILDDYNLELVLFRPEITFIHTMAKLGIVPKKKHDKNYINQPVGSGPFKLLSYVEGEKMIVERNDLYYGPKPSFKKILFLFTEPRIALMMAKKGMIDLMATSEGFSKENIKKMEIKRVRSVDNRGIMFPMTKNPVTKDIAIRKAINIGIDRDLIVKGVLHGFGSKAYGPIDDLPWDNPKARFEDGKRKEAIQLLESSGWKQSKEREKGIRFKNGVKASFELLYVASDTTRMGIALAVREQLKELGIEVKPKGVSWNEVEKKQTTTPVLFGWGSHNPRLIYQLYHSTNKGIDFYNPGLYENKFVDVYLDQAQESNSFKSSLVHWKNAQWDGKTGLSYHGDAPWAWLVNVDHAYFVHSCLDLGNLQIEPHGHGRSITSSILEWKWVCQ